MSRKEQSGPSVGYKRPPADRRFKPGQSGNPNGRPRGKRRGIPHDAVLGQMVSIRENGALRRVEAAEAFLLYLYKTGRSGQAVALEQALRAFEIGRSTTGASLDPVTDIVITSVDPENANLQLLSWDMVVKQDAFRPTARILIEPWLVEAALDRLGDRRLTPAEQITVWNATRTPKKVRWPEWWTLR